MPSYRKFVEALEGRYLMMAGNKLRWVDRSIINSFWGCSHVGCVFLASIRVSGGVLRMWDRRVVESLEMWKLVLSGLLQEYVDQMLILVDDFCGKK